MLIKATGFLNVSRYANDNGNFVLAVHWLAVPNLKNRRTRPYSSSEVIHRAGDKSPLFQAFERERPRIVNNFAASASPGYEYSSF